MRYSIISKGMSVDEITSLCNLAGVVNCRVARSLGQVFCDMSPSQAAILAENDGIVVKVVKTVRTQQILPPLVIEQPGGPSQAIPLAATVPIDEIFDPFKNSFSPPLTGVGLTVAVLDTGMRTTHEMLIGKVIYSANMTPEANADDIYDHGTGVASMIARIAPGARILNIKVLGDDGEGTEEDVVLGIEEVIEILEDAQANLLHLTADMYPNVINLSVGSDDDGDADDIVRVACREADGKFGLNVVAAAGNYGPSPTTVTSPATDPAVVAVGGMITPELLWPYSSRGPTLEGYVKPDILFWADSLNVASSTSDTAYLAKSGTSFSCSGLAGAGGLVWEAARSLLGDNFYMGRSVIEEIVSRFSGKPTGAPSGKDNDHGYGTPMPGMLMQEAHDLVTDEFNISDIIAPIFMIGIMGMMMKSIR